jgi:hypothetical protein
VHKKVKPFVFTNFDTAVSNPLLIDRPLKTTCIPLYSVYEIAYCNSNRYLSCAMVTEKMSGVWFCDDYKWNVIFHLCIKLQLEFIACIEVSTKEAAVVVLLCVCIDL